MSAPEPESSAAEVVPEPAPEQEQEQEQESKHMPSASPEKHAAPPASQVNWKEVWEESSKKLGNPSGKVTVRNPEVAGTLFGSSGKYVNYEVVSEATGVTVRRRFNDFAWLRESLVSRYAGLLIPALPGTKFSANYAVTGFVFDVNSDYIINRLAQLNTFMTELFKIPFLWQDAALYAFLNAQNEGGMKEAKESTKKSNSLEDTSPGAVAWRGILEGVQVPDDVDATLSDFRKMQEKLHTALTAIESAAAALGTKSLSFAREMHRFTNQSIKWSEQEVDHADEHNKLANKHGQRVKTLMKSLVVGCGNWSLNVALWPKTVASALFLNIQYQLMQVGAMQELLKHREETIRELEKAEQDLSNLLENCESAPASSPAATDAASTEEGQNLSPTAPRTRTKSSSISFSSMTAMFNKGTEEEQIEEKKTQVKYLTALVRNYTKGILFCEIDRFNGERCDNIQHMMGCLIAANILIAKMSEEKWQETATMAGVTVADYDEAAKTLVIPAAGAAVHGNDLEHLFSTHM